MSQTTEQDSYSAFNDIAPYDDCEFQEKMSQLIKEPGFEHAVRFVMHDVDWEQFTAGLLTIKTKDEFQHKIVAPFLEMLAMKTTSELSMSGNEQCSSQQNYTFITNHRDIVLDASFLNILFIRNDLPTSEIAIGSNLLIHDWISDLVKLNKSFIVKRGLRMLQALEAAKQLSGYIHYAINDKQQSVWIAHREGRAKDSNDVTQESLIKMLALAGKGNIVENLLEINLCPVSISYEYDPNDYLKAREFLLRRNDPEFKKSQRDDLFAMETGILQYKGKVHFHVAGCINDKLETLRGLTDKAEIVKRVCGYIDNAIHSGYKIYPINYIAYDMLNDTKAFTDKYTDNDIAEFNAYISSQLAKVDIPDLSEDDIEYMRQMVLTMYSNPLKNKLNAKN